MARIKVIQYHAAEGELKSIYDDLIVKRGQLPEVLKIQSLHPSSIKSHTAFYMDIVFSKSALSGAEKEMIAVVVSDASGCIYCQTHHSAALNNYWKDAQKIERLKIAVHLTKYPAAREKDDYTERLKRKGVDDAGILDVVMLTSYPTSLIAWLWL